MTKLNFLIFTHYFHPHLGGVEKHVLKTSQLLAEQGHDLQIITRRHQPELASQEQLNQYPITINRIKILPVKIIGLLYLWIRLIFKFNYLVKQADKILIHDVFIWYLPFKFLFPRKKVITVMHGWEGKYPIPFKNKLMKQIAAKLSDKVIVVGDYVQKYYRIKADQVIYGGVDQVLWDKNKSKNQKQFVFIGRLAQDTGLPLILNSADVLQDYQLIFCGDGDQNWRQQANIIGKVIGWQSEDSLFKILKKTKICFASGYLSALEAMAHGCLVFVTGNNLLKRDYWLDSPLLPGLVYVENSAELKKQLDFYDRNQLALQAKIQQAVEIAQKHSWLDIAQQYLQL